MIGLFAEYDVSVRFECCEFIGRGNGPHGIQGRAVDECRTTWSIFSGPDLGGCCFGCEYFEVGAVTEITLDENERKT